MKRTPFVSLAALLLLGLVTVAFAQDQEYALKDYMPQTVGSKWTMKTTNRQGDTTQIIEVAEPVDVAAQKASQILTKDASGNLQRGSLESVTDNAYYLFGTIRVPRGQQGGDPVTSLYDPMVVFPAKLKVGGHAEATTKMPRRNQANDLTMKLDLVAVESVTVPKGTFADCLKLVYTTAFGQGEMKRTVWYAKGLGIVKSEQAGGGQNNQAPRIAELLDYQLAEAQ
jgi:hypothetical protein